MKAGTLVPKKFRSVRDKSGSHRRNKSSEPGFRARPLSAESWFTSIFKPESVKQALKEKEEEEKETAKIEEIFRRLAASGEHDISPAWIRYSLASKYAGGDLDKTIAIVRLLASAYRGNIQPYDPNVLMLGAENRENVTCYLDSLLFAMFAKLSAFECMLENDPSDTPRKKLAALIRLWVNMLRSGKLIQTDITEHIQNALAECGWADAKELEQQDTSEAFAFITETLQLPLLTLQVDLFHQGKGDTDDHKVIHERLLNLAVPADPDGKGIDLEDCLEEYFNNQVEVFRDSLEEKKNLEKSISAPKTTIRIVTNDDSNLTGEAEGSPLQRRWTVQDRIVDSPIALSSPESASSAEPSRPLPRHRSTSIIQRIVVDDKGNLTDSDPDNFLNQMKRTGSTVVKAVTIPAWQFFRLIPWHAGSSTEPVSDIEVARHLNQRPVVGICLKRYTMTEQGFPQRLNTLIDIPDSLRLPHFMMVDGKVEEKLSGLNQEYKLVLQGVVCHRGDSVHSGHYISFARVAPKLLTDNRRLDIDPPPDYEEAQWAKFDDLDIEHRVSYVDDIKQSLKEEMPYLLFYQIVPMVDVAAGSTDGSVVEPPSYDESAVSLSAVSVAGHASTLPPTPLLEPTPNGASISRSTSGYFDSGTTLATSTGPSIRFSAELDRPPRLSLDEDRYLKTNLSRRGSIALTDPTAALTPSAAPSEVPSPSVTPQDETTGQRLARAAARFTKGGSRSRPTSQAGEGRISTTISRLGLVRSSKEHIRDGSSATLPIPVGIEGLDEGTTVVITEEGDEHEHEREHEHHHHHHHLHHHKKDRGKSKSRDKDKDKGKSKESKASGVPDRECLVM